MLLPSLFRHRIKSGLNIVMQMSQAIEIGIKPCREHAAIADMRGWLGKDSAFNEFGDLLDMR